MGAVGHVVQLWLRVVAGGDDMGDVEAAGTVEPRIGREVERGVGAEAVTHDHDFASGRHAVLDERLPDHLGVGVPADRGAERRAQGRLVEVAHAAVVAIVEKAEVGEVDHARQREQVAPVGQTHELELVLADLTGCRRVLQGAHHQLAPELGRVARLQVVGGAELALERFADLADDARVVAGGTGRGRPDLAAGEPHQLIDGGGMEHRPARRRAPRAVRPTGAGSRSPSTVRWRPTLSRDSPHPVSVPSHSRPASSPRRICAALI